MNIGFFGCSFTEGGGLDSKEWNEYGIKHNLISNEYNVENLNAGQKINVYTQYRDNHKFSTLVSKELGCDVRNYARSCNSNENIINSVFDKKDEHDILIIQLSLKQRVHWWYEPLESYFNINSSEFENYPYNGDSDKRKLQEMYVDHLYYTYNDEQVARRLKQYIYLFNQLDKKIYWMSWEDNDWIEDVPNLIRFESENSNHAMGNWAEENKYQFEYTTDGFYKDSHLDVKGNQMVAKKIVEVLNER